MGLPERPWWAPTQFNQKMAADTNSRESNCTVFPTCNDTSISANTAPLSEDKRATNCTTFPTGDALCISADGPVTENPTNQHQEAQQNLDNDLWQENSLAQALTGRAASSGKRPARHSPETEVRDGKRVASPFCQEGAPWPKYHQFATLGTSGTTFLAVDPTRQTPRIVAVKEVKTFDLKLTQNLIRIVHQNIVALHEAWLSTDKVYLVYERMDVTLDRLQQFHQFKEEHISTVCHEASTPGSLPAGEMADAAE
jgi:hypothetical protein